MASARSRPILVLERRAQDDSITAAVFVTDTTDYIFCRADIQGLHRDHAICHELGHLISGHPDLPEFAIYRRSSARDVVALERACDYGPDREREAEAIADEIMGRVVQQLAPRATPRQRVLRGFDDALR